MGKNNIESFNKDSLRVVREGLKEMLQKESYYTGTNCTGLCGWASCISSPFNFESTAAYIKQNRPSKYSSLDAYLHRNSVWYWEPHKIKPRIKWLKKHIAILDKQLGYK